jgi:small subunit ribosomal protein S2
LLITREINRLSIRLSGVRMMKKVPDLIFVVDVSREETSVHEANLTKIPVLAMVDTNCDPRGVDYVIPSNDDAIRAIKLLVSKVADAVLEGKASRKEEEGAEAVEPMKVSLSMPLRSPLENEDELEDVELLGAATLAKLSPPKVVEPEAEVVKEVVTEEVKEEATEEVIEEATEEVKEEATEEVKVVNDTTGDEAAK